MKAWLLAVTTSAMMCVGISAASAAVKSGEEITFSRLKGGLLMSAGVIEMIRKEGDIALDDERITCHRVRKTGSHMKETYCMTLHEAEVARTRNQRTMWRYLNGAIR